MGGVGNQGILRHLSLLATPVLHGNQVRPGRWQGDAIDDASAIVIHRDCTLMQAVSLQFRHSTDVGPGIRQLPRE